jgi:hypothetical protein
MKPSTLEACGPRNPSSERSSAARLQAYLGHAAAVARRGREILLNR